MFESFTDTVTIVRMIQSGDVARLRKVVAAGAKIDRRTTYDPWMTPLDAAAATQNYDAATILLAGGAPIFGSSIFEAIHQDAVDILRLFHKVDANFHQRFRSDSNNRINPRLNRWLSIFTALDLAISISARNCVEFLEEIGARKHANFKTHQLDSCTAVFIEEESFLSFGGVNIDGLAEVTAGFYCAKCERFIN